MKFRFTFTLLFASAFVLAAHAQSPAPQAHIAVIAFQAAVGETNEAQRDFADLQKKYEPKREQLKALSDEVVNLQKQLKSDQDKLSQPDLAKRAKVIADKQKQLKRELEDTQKSIQDEMEQMMGALSVKVYDVLLDYAKKQGITNIIDTTIQQNSAPTVLYADPSSDITKIIIDAYNVKSGIPAPAAPAVKAAPTTAPHTAPKAPGK